MSFKVNMKQPMFQTMGNVTCIEIFMSSMLKSKNTF
jgi:hypothetical protein